MPYGRRFFEKPRNLSAANPDQSERRQRNITGSTYRAFRGKYTLFLVTAVVGSLLVFAIPTVYFLNQNYEIFSRLAYEIQPQLLSHLDREYGWLIGFMVASFLALGFFGLWIGLRVTRAVIQPLNAMEIHMKQAILGDWRNPEFQSRNSEDLRSLLETYNYFYRAMRTQAESDLKYLQRIVVDPSHREAYQIWQSLVSNKREQLGLSEEVKIVDPAATFVATDLTRHAS